MGRTRTTTTLGVSPKIIFRDAFEAFTESLIESDGGGIEATTVTGEEHATINRQTSNNRRKPGSRTLDATRGPPAQGRPARSGPAGAPPEGIDVTNSWPLVYWCQATKQFTSPEEPNNRRRAKASSIAETQTFETSTRGRRIYDTQPAACGTQGSAMSKRQKNNLRSYWGNKGASASSSTNAGAPPAPPSIPGSAPPARARAGALTDGGASLVDAAAAAASTARDDSEENAARAGGRKRSGKKAKKDSSSKKKKKKRKLPGEPWEFTTAERAAGPPRPIPQQIELAIPYHPADPPSVVERTIVLQSDDKHLRELNGPGVTVYIRRDDEIDQFQLVGKPVLSNVPRSVSFAEGGDGQLVLQLSTRVHECITTFSGSPSWSWREEDAVPDSAVDVVAAIHSARELHDVISNDYGIVVNLPELKFPSAEELVSARDDLDAMAGHLGRVMDQYHLLTVVETVLQRCVANYMKITERRYMENQERERARAAEERRRAGMEDSGVNHDQADDTVVLSYGALHERFRNSVQQEAVDDYIETLARPMFRLLRDDGSVMTHGCHGNGDFDYAAQDIATMNPVLYFAHPQHKSGSASHGRLKKEVLTE
ncbi:hypothetical protein THAOC_36444, partial [Thalassiosira oceanica]